MGTLQLAIVGLAGSLVGSALGTPMLWPTHTRPVSVRLFGAWLMALSGIAGLISSRLLGLAPATAATNHAINLLGFTAYPLLYLWIVEQSGRSVSIRRSLWLWIPAALYVGVLGMRGAFGLSTHVPFEFILPAILAFTLLCAAAAFREQAANHSSIVPARMVVGFLAALNVSQVIRMVFGHVSFVQAVVPITIAAGLLALSAAVMQRVLTVQAMSATQPSEPRYDHSGLDDTEAATLLADIHHAVAVRRLFTNPELTLRHLAASVNATPHQVSETLNRHAGMTFQQLITRHRVDDVKQQLLEATSDKFTIEGIGGTAGFGSRSALYSAFRRLEGITPAEFRARARAAASASRSNT